MSLSDCVKCWDTPCSCGYDYRYWDKKRRIKQAAVILGISMNQLSVLTATTVPEEHPKKNEE